jgi:hypothetical protein
VAKYGLEDDKLRKGGRLTSVWWRDLWMIREGVGLSVGR